ncbi:hypothetical protein HK18_06635 [Commensalibacter intestini]|uniref:Uncharacterized protein n=1 Tax=Commensalibacter intestini TaxID=479936 RepID=A0A251ZSG1_9PROT|nr:hypothetical protein [Commensalibacter intestini]OUI77597.1 hypothetical protein HK18_06635 [Commensalibacter intestini]
MLKSSIGDNYIKCHVVELPNWFSMHNKQMKNQFIIGEITNGIEVSEAKDSLKNLEILYHTSVDYQVFIDFFKVINLLIAKPLNQKNFHLKMKPLYALFKNYSLILFNEQTCKELAILSPFFPSAYDIDKVMTNNIQKITKNIELLREIIL